MDKLRIALINLTAGGMSGGYRKYLRNVIPRMAANPAVEALLCASSLSLSVHDWFERIPNVKFVDCKPDPELYQHLIKFSPDVLFIPTERSFRFNKVPIVNMIQNMEQFVNNIDGNPFSEKIRQWIQYLDSKRAIKKSDRVIAISEFVRDFLVQYLKIQPERIGVIYHGIDLPEDEWQCPICIPKGWDGQFIFTAGSIRPARGLEDLLYAIKYLSENSYDTPKLVIAGETTNRMLGYRKKLEGWVRANNLMHKISWTDSLNEKEMTWCYRNCRAFVMTSRVESFGMIAGEAMLHGCACISADNPCLPEIFGDAAVYYPPKNGNALAEAIQTVLAWDSDKRNEASEQAKKRAADFSWDVCVEKTVAELSKAVKNYRDRKQ